MIYIDYVKAISAIKEFIHDIYVYIYIHHTYLTAVIREETARRKKILNISRRTETKTVGVTQSLPIRSTRISRGSSGEKIRGSAKLTSQSGL